MMGGLVTLLISIATVFASSGAHATVDGSAIPIHYSATHHTDSTLSLSLGFDGVSDQVAYEPHQQGGGFSAIEKKPRYVAARVGLHWTPTPSTDVRAGFTSHSINSKRDQYELDTWHLSLRHDLPITVDPVTLSIGVSIGSNKSQALTKTSFTRYNEWRVTRARLSKASDLQLQANLFGERYFSDQVHGIIYAGFGQAISKNEGFDGIVQDQENCRYAVSLHDAHNTVSLLEPCGQIQSLTQEFNSRDAFEARYGFDTDADFTGKTRFWHLGAQLARNTQRNNYGIGLHFQHFDRGALDSRLQDRGGKPLELNYSTSAWWHHRLKPRWTIETGAEYSLRPMLNRLHVLYTGFTSERFSTSALILNLSIRYRF